MKKVSNKKGFTLAELLIVVAIIAVLVAIAIPVFGTALNKAKHAADLAETRASYAEKVVAAMTDETYDADGKITVYLKTTATNGSAVTYEDNTVTVTFDATTDIVGTFPVDSDVKVTLNATGAAPAT